MSPGTVEVRGVSRRFGAVTALDAVDLTLAGGGFHSLLGPSGCGKTTLLRILSGFDAPDAGDVAIDGRSVLGLPANRRPTNIVFQRYALFPHLSVADNIAFGLTTGGGRRHKARRPETRSAVADMLDLVGLSGFEGRFPGQLSGGQAQRVAVARALINSPQLLLLDEPLSALDQNVRLAMRERLLRIHAETHTTFLLVTHDQEEALSMSTSVALMNAGRVVQVGTPTQLYREPATLFAAGFIGAGSLVDVRVAAVAGPRAQVSVASLTWEPLAIDVAAGQRAAVFLRPEELLLAGESDGRVDGVVAAAVFLGAQSEITVDTEIGRLRLRTGHQPQVGESVRVGWSTTAGRCYRRAGESGTR